MSSEEYSEPGTARSPEDENDYIYDHLAASSGIMIPCIPDTFKLGKLRARNQGKRPTCASFVAAAIRQAQLEADFEFSPEFIYHHRSNNNTEGMYPRNVFSIMQKIGIVPEEKYKYNTNSPPSREVIDLAKRYKITEYMRIKSIESVKRALVELGPCFLLLPQYNHDTYFWRDTNINKRGSISTPMGHAVTIIGYTLEGFILLNSWGENYGINGTVVYPYTEWNMGECPWECWACTTNLISSRKYNDELYIVRLEKEEEKDKDKTKSKTSKSKTKKKKKKRRCL